MARNVHNAIRQRREKLAIGASLQARTAEWFGAQRTFFQDRARLVAAVCGRRAGKTRGGCLAMLLEAATTLNGRFLYINATRQECLRLAWYGLRGDGMYSLATKLGLNCRFNSTSLSIHFPDLDSWIYLMGADDESGIRKALGLAYHQIWWDEAQKIPAKLEHSIRAVLMPTLLDYGGQLRLTGTPVREMSGLFYNATRTDGGALGGWSVHRWNLLDNPFFGRAVPGDGDGGGWRVVTKAGRTRPTVYATEEEANLAAHQERFASGILELQESLGGADAAPLDSPLMQREAFGQWVHEDALYVYAIHRVPRETLVYAPARYAPLVLPVPRMESDRVVNEMVGFDRFPDVDAALNDLPGYPRVEYLFCLGADIGWQDPFAWTLVAWSGRDPVLYEVAAWGSRHLDQPTQAAVLRYVCDRVGVGMVVADGGGSVLPTVKGWSREWVNRYNVPIDEAEKTNKAGAIEALNGDLVRGRYRLRSDSPLIAQMEQLQWVVIRSGTGRLIENPMQANDQCDASLYAHRRSYPHRYQPEPIKPQYGTEEYFKQEEERMFHASQETDAFWH